MAERAHAAEWPRCAVCRGSAIERVEQAQPLFDRLVEWVKRQGLPPGNVPFHVELVDQARLAHLIQRPNHMDALGATLRVLYSQQGQVVQVEVRGVAVLHGLPATLFQGVAVHELGHVWLAIHGVRGLPSWTEEGFCNLLSHGLYEYLATAESRFHAQAMERSADFDYGEGFRRVRAVAQRVGFRPMVEAMRASRSFPFPA